MVGELESVGLSSELCFLLVAFLHTRQPSFSSRATRKDTQTRATRARVSGRRCMRGGAQRQG